jgi:hypothetical protein
MLMTKATYDTANEDQPWIGAEFDDGSYIVAGEKMAQLFDADGALLEEVYKSAFHKTEQGRLYEQCAEAAFEENPTGEPIERIEV